MSTVREIAFRGDAVTDLKRARGLLVSPVENPDGNGLCMHRRHDHAA